MFDSKQQKLNTNTKTDQEHFRVTQGRSEGCTSVWKTIDLNTDHVVLLKWKLVLESLLYFSKQRAEFQWAIRFFNSKESVQKNDNQASTEILSNDAWFSDSFEPILFFFWKKYQK